MKARFEVLDGLRGTAALLVVIFHVLEMTWLDPAQNPLHHAYLAVDFFFALSGFVVGHAYDDRRAAGMTIGQFFATRLKRLHPLVILGVVIGLVGYVVDPFVGKNQQVGLGRLMLTFLPLLLTLPSPGLPNRYGETHSLNGPVWTLFQEYLANIVYALIGRWIGIKALAAVVLIAAVALTVTAAHHGFLGAGWGWDTVWIAPVRMLFPFLAGLLVYRLKIRIRIPAAWPLLSLALIAVFAAPFLSIHGTIKPNGLLEAAMIILLFPPILAMGAAGTVSGATARVCRFFGELSYPLYITHYPFIYVYGHWVWSAKPDRATALGVGAVLIVFLLALAWAAMRFWDAPIRARLGR